MRRVVTRWTVPAIVVWMLVVIQRLAVVGPASPSRAQTKPNIVLIITDDMDAEALAYMPNTATLIGDQGLSFERFFVTTPLCCPSRASILRGQYAHNHGVLFNFPPRGGFQEFRRRGHDRSTIGRWLHAAGYKTGLVGRYLVGYPDGAGPT